MKRLLILIVLATLFAVPVLAKEATPEVVPTVQPVEVPAPEGDIIITVENPPAEPGVVESAARDWGVLIIATIALVVIGVVARTGIVTAAAGVPPAVFDTAVFGIERGLDVLEKGATVTPTPLDDTVIAELRRAIADLARQVEENRITTGAQNVK